MHCENQLDKVNDVIMVATGRPYTGKKFPPRGNYVIPARGDYVQTTTRSSSGDLVEAIKRSVDWARMCLDHGRPDLADNTLRVIWSMADAIERK